jgi:NDP-sugar pyrophosphorylase family protein
MMQCVILAGGLGTRLGPIAEGIPKALAVVAGRAFADWQLEWLEGEGVSRVVYCVGHLGDQIESHVGDGRAWGVEVTYSREGESLLGTAGALRLAADAGLLDEDFFVLYGDSYLSVPMRDVELRYRAADAPCLMTVFRNDGRWGTSNAIYRDGRVLEYRKGSTNPPAEMRWIDYGLSVLDRRVIEDNVPQGVVWDLATELSREASRGRIAGYEAHQRFYEIGSPEGLTALEQKLHSHARGGDGGR